MGRRDPEAAQRILVAWGNIMTLRLDDLDNRTRELMVAELELDLTEQSLYMSTRFTPAGTEACPELLREAFESGDDESLSLALAADGMLKMYEEGRRGATIYKKRVPSDAARTYGQGEFNRFYLRALCVRAIADGIQWLEIYRTKDVTAPRPESTALEGSRVDPRGLRDDLRAHKGVDTALGLPPGPNSGLSARIPKS
jgi:hypothetical protein